MLKRISNFILFAAIVLASAVGCTRQRPIELPAKPEIETPADSADVAETEAAPSEASATDAEIAAEAPLKTPTTEADSVESTDPVAQPAESLPKQAAASAKKPAAPTQTAPSTEAPTKAAPAELAQAEVAAAAKTRIATVKLTESHKALCKVGVGDAMPTIELPNLEGQSTPLSSFYGQKATVVVFFDSRLALSRMQLADLSADVVEPFSKQGVRAVLIAVNQTAEQAQQSLAAADAKLPTLVDTAGEGLAQVGSERTSRTYVLDSTGKIVWFDIEYSRSTRRELHGAITHLLSAPEERNASATDTQPTAATASAPAGKKNPM